MKKSIIALSLIAVSGSVVASTTLTDGFELGYVANSKAYDVKLEGYGEYVHNSGVYNTAYLTGVDELDILSSAVTIGYTWFIDEKMVNLHGSYGFGSKWEVTNAEGDFDDSYSIGVDYGLKILTPTTFVGVTAEYNSNSYNINETGEFYGFPATARVLAEIKTLDLGLFVKHYINNHFWVSAEAGLSFDAGSEYKESFNAYSSVDRVSGRVDGELDGTSPFFGLSAGVKF